MVIKWPPPMPILCAFIIELQRPEAIVASTAEPFRSRIFLLFVSLTLILVSKIG